MLLHWLVTYSARHSGDDLRQNRQIAIVEIVQPAQVAPMKKAATVAKAGGIMLLAVLAFTAIACFIWYNNNRTDILSRLCEAGLPNFSRPSVVRSGGLRCAILGPKRRVEGVLLTGFEAANFMSKDLGPAPSGGGFSGNTWYTPNQVSPRNDRADQQLEQRIPGVCSGLATLVVEGWPTVSSGHYGHMGMYAREFFEDRVIAVKPPPPDIVQRMRAAYAKAGLSNCSFRNY